MDQAADFTGWAKVELMGHNVEIGFVTTRYFGPAALFQIDVPGVEEHDETLLQPEYVGEDWCPRGTVVKRPEIKGRTSMVGPSTIYRLTPCSEEVAKKALESRRPRAMAVVSFPPNGAALPAPAPDDDGIERDDDDQPNESDI
jgi:hypothetical protein